MSVNKIKTFSIKILVFRIHCILITISLKRDISSRIQVTLKVANRNKHFFCVNLCYGFRDLSDYTVV